MGKDKKKRKKSSLKRKHKSKHASSTDDSSSSAEEWVEMDTSSKDTPKTQNDEKIKEEPSIPKEVKIQPELDDWMSNESLFPSITRKEIRLKKEKEKEKNKDDRYMLDKLGQTNRELNPYWKDGGAGLPPEKTVTADSLRQASVTVGDQGVNWLRKALLRAKEEAAEQGRPLESVVAERWGSLEKLENMIAAAEQGENHHRTGKSNNFRVKDRLSNKPSDVENRGRSKNYDHDRKNQTWRTENTKRSFAKPAHSDDETSVIEDKFRRQYHDDRKKASLDYREKGRSRTVRSSNSSTDGDESLEVRGKNKKTLSSPHESRRHHSKERFAKPSGSNSDDEERHRSGHNNRYEKVTNKRHSKERFAKPSDSSSDEDHRKYRSGSKSKHEILSSKRHSKERFSKPSDSSSDEERRKYRSSSKSRHENLSSKRHSKERFAKPFDSSSDEDHRKYRSGSKSKHEKVSSKRHSKERFAKPSDSSSDDDEGRCRSNQRRHENVSNESHRRQTDLSKNHSNKYRYKEDRISTIKDFAGIRSGNSHSSSATSTGWRKKKLSNEDQKREIIENENPDSKSAKEEESNSAIEEEPALTDKEMNDLGAKIVKAEILGNMELAEELKKKLQRAREVKANKPKEGEANEKVVILTHLDSKGFERPVSFGETPEPSGGRRKSKKVDTHSGGKRMRYFADDDKYTLQDMFQREKLSTVEDSNEVFAKLASKGVGRDESARDMDDVFEETACVEESEGKIQARSRQQAIEHSKRVARSLESCQWCIESRQMMKHLIVAMGQKCYLCVPPHQSLTENHCLIVPNYHTSCGTQADEDVWREMQEFRQSLVQMFLSQDEDVVFFENARYLNKFPHMVLNCVPMPKETGDLAPIYFKKAIQECEMEWSNNKKLVELKGRDVRRAVPKGLPYFSVDFGLESGFAHVIEDEKLFPHNFAQEIIGGMLDLDHTIWRKQRKQTFEEQSKKVIKLAKLWSPFSCINKSS